MHCPAETAPRDARLLSGGVGNMLLATLAFSTMNVFVNQLDRIPATEIVFFRCLVSGMICGVEIARHPRCAARSQRGIRSDPGILL